MFSIGCCDLRHSLQLSLAFLSESLAILFLWGRGFRHDRSKEHQIGYPKLSGYETRSVRPSSANRYGGVWTDSATA
jgi:hypothetical protein